MYGVVFSFKDPFDTKDMRSTSGGDAAYDIDVPARDHVLVEQLRSKGAIIYAKAVSTEYNGRAGNPGGRHAPAAVLPSTLGYQRSSWAGNPANPVRHHALGLARIELGLGSLRQHQPGHGQPGRGDARLDARAGQPQRGGADPAAQGPARVRRRRHRRRHLLRSHRDPLPHHRRLRAGCSTRSRIRSRATTIRAIRSRPFRARRSCHAVRRPRDVAGHARRARGHAHRRDPRVDGVPAGLVDGDADRDRGRQGDQGRARRHAGRHAGRVDRSELDAGSGRWRS